MSRRICGVILALAALMAFLPVGPAEFLLWDDYLHLVSNPHLKLPLFEGGLPLWWTSYQGLYNPLIFSLWKLWIVLIETVRPAWREQNFVMPFLLLNLGIHTLNAWLLFDLVQKPLWTWRVSSRLGALVVALFFLLHPVQVESVAWATGFKELIWVTFALLALHFFARGKHIAMVTMVCLALLCKPTAMILPILILLARPDFLKRKSSWVAVSAIFAVSLLFAVLTKNLQPNALVESAGLSLEERLQVACDALGFYWQKWIWPLHLAPDYGRKPSAVLALGWHVEIGIGLVAAAILGGLCLCRSPRWRFVAAWILLPLVPVLGWIPFLFQNYSTVADRYLYFSTAGWALGAILFGERWLGKKLLPVAAVGLFIYLVSCRIQTEHWRTNETLFQHTIQINPKSYMAENNLGIVAIRREDWPQAEIHLKQALSLNALYRPAVQNLAVVLLHQEKFEETQAFLPKYMALEPQMVELRLFHSDALIGLGRLEQALKELYEASHLAPANAMVLEKLGLLHSQMGQHQESLEYLRRAVELEPDNPTYQFNFQRAQEF